MAKKRKRRPLPIVGAESAAEAMSLLLRTYPKWWHGDAKEAVELLHGAFPVDPAKRKSAAWCRDRFMSLRHLVSSRQRRRYDIVVGNVWWETEKERKRREEDEEAERDREEEREPSIRRVR